MHGNGSVNECYNWQGPNWLTNAGTGVQTKTRMYSFQFNHWSTSD